MIFIIFFVVLVSIGKAVKMEISISKIRNSTMIKKNWNEKGIRIWFMFENPHSIGEFEEVVDLFFMVEVFTIINKILIIVVIIKVANIDFIISFIFLDWKSNVV